MSLDSVRICRETGLNPNRSCPLIKAPVLSEQTPSGYCPHEHPKIEKKYYGLWFRPSTPVKTKKRKQSAPVPTTPKTKSIEELRKDLLEQREKEEEEESVVPPVPFE